MFLHAVEPPVSDHPKCTQKTWSLTGGGRLQESNHMGPLPIEKRSGHIYFMEDNLLHAISKLRHV